MDKCTTTYLISLLLLIIMKIEASVTSLDCNHGVCPQTQGAVTCTITGSIAEWYSSPSKYIATVSSVQVINVANPEFTATLVSINNLGLTTKLSFNATTDKNGTQVRCFDRQDKISSTCIIMISGPPSNVPTGLGFTALTNTSVTLYWSPPTLHPNCIVNYTVEIRTTSDNILISSLSTGSNITSINVSTGLSQSVEYQSMVVASDIINRLGPYSQYTMFILDILQAVPLITYDITKNTENYTIVVIWESPPLSSCPPLLYYKVYHNISSSLTVNITTITNITLTGVLAGYTYIITVVPVNILGDGYPNKTIVTTTTSSSSSAGIYYVIGAVGGIIVLTLIAVVLVLTGCIMIRRKNKNNKSSGSPLTVSLRSIKDNNIEEISSNLVYAEVNKKPNTSPTTDNDQPPPIPLFHGRDEPPLPTYNKSVTTQYPKVMKKHATPNVQPHTSTAAGGDYSVLKRDDISHVPLHNVIAEGDYSVIKRDDASHGPPYSTSAGGDYSVFNREERESRENNSQSQLTNLYSTLNNEQNKPTKTMPKEAGSIVYDELGNAPKN